MSDFVIRLIVIIVAVNVVLTNPVQVVRIGIGSQVAKTCVSRNTVFTSLNQQVGLLFSKCFTFWEIVYIGF